MNQSRFMKLAGVFLALISLLLIGMLIMYYWFVPTDGAEFSIEKSNNFSLDNNKVLMQFHENMRFPEKTISYSIEKSCSIQKKSDMRWAFDIIEYETILEFYELPVEGQIIVECENKNRVEEGLFIAGEGGPTNITKGENFNVILGGQILLIRDSDCEKPNVAIHELLHVLGFNHSENENNIMYPVSQCKQTIGEEIPAEINRLYEIPSFPDLIVRNVDAETHGRYVDLNISVFNDGLKVSNNPELIIFADDKEIKRIQLNDLEIGTGLSLELTNLFLSKFTVDKIEIVVESSDSELSLENNQILLAKI